MVEVRDVLGFAADVGTSFLVDKGLTKFGAGSGLGKELIGGAISGGVGGIAGTVVADGGFNINNVVNGAKDGAIGGAFGSGIAHFWGKSLTKGKTAADNALNDASSARTTAVSEREALDTAETARDAARTQLNDAAAELQRANNEVASAQAEVDNLIAQTNADPTNAVLRERLARAEGRLDIAKSEQRAADTNHESAKRKLEQANAEYNELDAKRGELDNAKRTAEEGAEKAEAAAKAVGKKVEDFGKYYRGTLIGLGSAAGVYLGEHGLPFVSDESGGNPPGTAANRVALVWDGYAPAAAAGVMGIPPFEKGSSPTDGEGFLLRPKELNPSIVTWFGGPSNSFASSLVDTHQMFGDLKKKETLKIEPIPMMPDSVQGVTGSAGGRTYKNASNALNDSAKFLSKTQGSVVSALETVEEVSKTGKENVGKLIVGFNRYIVQHLRNGSDIEFITVSGQGFAELVKELERAAAENSDAAARIKQPSVAQDQAAAQNLANSVGRYAGQQYNPGLTPDSSRIGLNNPWNPGDLGTSSATTPDTSALKDATEKFRDQADKLSDSANTPPSINPASFDPGASNPAAFNPGAAQMGTGGSMGGMGSLMDMMLPLQLMGMQKAREEADTDMASRMDELDPSRFDQAAVSTLPQAQQPVGTTPWSNQVAANNAAATPAQPAAHHPAGAPNGATSTQPATTVPKRVPGEDGLVPYAFPDGRTQRVPVAVAQALDKAFANKNGTDAQAAYQGTAGAWTDSKDIGEGVYPPKTGDVVTFIIRQPKNEPQQAESVPARADTGPQILPAAVVTVGGDTGEKEQPPKNEPDTGSSGDSKYRTALLVAFGDGESGTLEAVVNGELRQYEAEMSDTEGDFGEFAGFKRPRGVTATGDQGQDSEAMATSGDQTTADIPALTMPV